MDSSLKYWPCPNCKRYDSLYIIIPTITNIDFLYIQVPYFLNRLFYQQIIIKNKSLQIYWRDYKYTIATYSLK